MQAGFSHYFAKTPAGVGVGADRREAAETEHHPARAARICLRELEAGSAAPLASSPTGGAGLSAMPGLYRAPPVRVPQIQPSDKKRMPHGILFSYIFVSEISLESAVLGSVKLVLLALYVDYTEKLVKLVVV